MAVFSGISTVSVVSPDPALPCLEGRISAPRGERCLSSGLLRRRISDVRITTRKAAQPMSK